MPDFNVLLQEHLDLARGLDVAALQVQLNRAVELSVQALEKQCPLLVCGNGGSAADAQHIAGELVGKFLKDRRALNVQCLSSNTSALTAWGNDSSFDAIFARQVEAHGLAGGVLWAISTSGRSRNVLLAAQAARARGLSVVALTGAGGGDLAALCDVLIAAPTASTPRIQEFHILYYHYLCQQIEARFSTR
ncbi:MAG: SIS domain-containing protein [Pseudomonadota bacterium]